MFDIDNFIEACENAKIYHEDLSIAYEGFFTADKDPKPVVVNSKDMTDEITVNGRGFIIPNASWPTKYWDKYTMVSDNFFNNLKYIETYLDTLDRAFREYKTFSEMLPDMAQNERDQKYNAFSHKYFDTLNALNRDFKAGRFSGLPRSFSAAEKKKLVAVSTKFVTGYREVIDDYMKYAQKREQASTLKKVFMSNKVSKQAGANGFLFELVAYYKDLWVIFSNAATS